MRKITIGMADDLLLLRQSIKSLLKDYEELDLVFDVDNGVELLEKLVGIVPDVLLLDIEMPVMGGREALQRIAIEYPSVKVIMFSSYFNGAFVTDFIKLGAVAFLPKGCDLDTLIDAINDVFSKGRYYKNIMHFLGEGKALKKLKPSRFPNTGLTQREREILDLLRQSKSNSEMAEILFLSIRTVEHHRLNLMWKTSSKNVQALMLWASQNIMG